MSTPAIRIDDRAVKEVFARFPLAAARRLMQLIEGAAIDTQGEMRRQINVGVTGDARRSIRYRTYPATLSAVIEPNVPYADALEEGSRPHWTSARPGSPLAQWAKSKGINPYAVQRSIATKGTKAHPYIEPTYRTMLPRVQRDVTGGFARFIAQVDGGNV